MSWCPVCKNEYREGVETCSECKVPLVQELTSEAMYTLLATTKEEADAKRLIKYLEYSEIQAEMGYDAESEAYAIGVPEKDLLQAKKAFHAFYLVETEKKQKQDVEGAKNDPLTFIDPDFEQEDGADEGREITTRESEDVKNPSEPVKNDTASLRTPTAVYVKKSEQSKEMKSTAITFFIFGFLLLAFGILNLFKIITLFSNVIALVTVFALSACSFAIGINSLGRAKRAELDAVQEEALTKSLNQWLDANITIEILKKMDDASFGDEANYLRRIEEIKTRISSELGDMDDTYLDSIIEEYYSAHFD